MKEEDNEIPKEYQSESGITLKGIIITIILIIVLFVIMAFATGRLRLGG